MQWDMEVLPRDGELLRSMAAAIPQDGTFASFVAAVRDAGAAIEIVSDGLGFYVASNLARLDPALADLPIATNENDVDGSGRLSFPYGHPACFVCGTCKRERVRAHEAGGRVVVFVGDGQSDRYAAHHADIVWAKDALLAWGRATGRDFLAWERFADIEAWFLAALARRTAPGAAGGPGGLAGDAPPAPARLHLRPGGLGPRPDGAGRARIGVPGGRRTRSAGGAIAAITRRRSGPAPFVRAHGPGRSRRSRCARTPRGSGCRPRSAPSASDPG